MQERTVRCRLGVAVAALFLPAFQATGPLDATPGDYWRIRNVGTGNYLVMGQLTADIAQKKLTFVIADEADATGYMNNVDKEQIHSTTYYEPDECIWEVLKIEAIAAYSVRNTRADDLLGNPFALYTNAPNQKQARHSDYGEADIYNTELHLEQTQHADGAPLFYLYVLHNGKRQYLVPMRANFAPSDGPLSLVSEDYFDPYTNPNSTYPEDYSENSLTEEQRYQQFVWEFEEAGHLRTIHDDYVPYEAAPHQLRVSPSHIQRNEVDGKTYRYYMPTTYRFVGYGRGTDPCDHSVAAFSATAMHPDGRIPKNASFISGGKCLVNASSTWCKGNNKHGLKEYEDTYYPESNYKNCGQRQIALQDYCNDTGLRTTYQDRVASAVSAGSCMVFEPGSDCIGNREGWWKDNDQTTHDYNTCKARQETLRAYCNDDRIVTHFVSGETKCAGGYCRVELSTDQVQAETIRANAAVYIDLPHESMLRDLAGESRLQWCRMPIANNSNTQAGRLEPLGLAVEWKPAGSWSSYHYSAIEPVALNTTISTPSNVTRAPTRSFTHFKFEVTKVRGGGDYFELAELHFQSESGARQDLTGCSTSTALGNGTGASAIDGQLDTPSPGTRTGVTDVKGRQSFGIDIVCTKALSVYSISYSTTDDDNPYHHHDPVRFRLSGAQSDARDWRVIADYTHSDLQVPTARKAETWQLLVSPPVDAGNGGNRASLLLRRGCGESTSAYPMQNAFGDANVSSGAAYCRQVDPHSSVIATLTYLTAASYDDDNVFRHPTDLACAKATSQIWTDQPEEVTADAAGMHSCKAGCAQNGFPYFGLSCPHRRQKVYQPPVAKSCIEAPFLETPIPPHLSSTWVMANPADVNANEVGLKECNDACASFVNPDHFGYVATYFALGCPQIVNRRDETLGYTTPTNIMKCYCASHLDTVDSVPTTLLIRNPIYNTICRKQSSNANPVPDNAKCRTNSAGRTPLGQPGNGDDETGIIRTTEQDYLVGGAGTLSVYHVMRTRLQCKCAAEFTEADRQPLSQGRCTSTTGTSQCLPAETVSVGSAVYETGGNDSVSVYHSAENGLFSTAASRVPLLESFSTACCRGDCSLAFGSTSRCSGGKTHKAALLHPKLAAALCQGPQCKKAECCDRYCDSFAKEDNATLCEYDAPAFLMAKSGAGGLMCSNNANASTLGGCDVATCCASRGTCPPNDSVCGSNPMSKMRSRHYGKLTPDDRCASLTCIPQDCCRRKCDNELCQSFAPFGQLVVKDDAALLTCTGYASSSAECKTPCCTGHCDSNATATMCAAKGGLPDSAHADRRCDGLECTHVECCTQTCASNSCSDAYKYVGRKTDSSSIPCPYDSKTQRYVCSDQLCCEPRGDCNEDLQSGQITCPVGQTVPERARTHPCTGVLCEASECCRVLGTCTPTDNSCHESTSSRPFSELVFRPDQHGIERPRVCAAPKCTTEECCTERTTCTSWLKTRNAGGICSGGNVRPTASPVSMIKPVANSALCLANLSTSQPTLSICDSTAHFLTWPSQGWTLDAAGRLRIGSKCLVVSHVTASSAIAKTEDCGGDDSLPPSSQRWMVTASPYLARLTYAAMWQKSLWSRLDASLKLSANSKTDSSVAIGTAVSVREDCLRLCQEQKDDADHPFVCRYFEFVPHVGNSSATCLRMQNATVLYRASGELPHHEYHTVAMGAFGREDRCRGPTGGSATTCAADECCESASYCANKETCTKPHHIKTAVDSKLCSEAPGPACTDDDCGCKPTCTSKLTIESAFCGTDRYIPFAWRSNGSACAGSECTATECCAPVPKCGQNYKSCLDEKSEIDYTNWMARCIDDGNDVCSDDECCTERKNCTSYTTCAQGDPMRPAPRYGVFCSFLPANDAGIRLSHCDGNHCCEPRRRCFSHTCGVSTQRVPYATRNKFCVGTPQAQYNCTDEDCDCQEHVCGGALADNGTPIGRLNALRFCRELTTGFVSDWRPIEEAVGGVCNRTTQSGLCDFTECCEKITSPPQCKDFYGISGGKAKNCLVSPGRCWNANRANKRCGGYGSDPCDDDTCCDSDCETAPAAPSNLVTEQGELTNSNEHNGGSKEQWHEKDEFRIGIGVAGAVMAAGIGSLLAFLIVKNK